MWICHRLVSAADHQKLEKQHRHGAPITVASARTIYADSSVRMDSRESCFIPISLIRSWMSVRCRRRLQHHRHSLRRRLRMVFLFRDADSYFASDTVRMRRPFFVVVERFLCRWNVKGPNCQDKPQCTLSARRPLACNIAHTARHPRSVYIARK